MKPNEVSARFGARVQQLRADRGMSQAELAERLTHQLEKKIDPVTVLRMEKDQRPTSVVELAALAAVFQVEVSALLEDGDPLAAEVTRWLAERTRIEQQRTLATVHLAALTDSEVRAETAHRAWKVLADNRYRFDETKAAEALEALLSVGPKLLTDSFSVDSLTSLLESAGIDSTILDSAREEADDIPEAEYDGNGKDGWVRTWPPPGQDMPTPEAVFIGSVIEQLRAGDGSASAT